MKSISAEERRRLLRDCRSEAVHLEMRDIYATDVEKGRFAAWRRGERLDPQAEAEWWRPWFELMRPFRESGKVLRRLRIVSEPVTEYIRFEWLDTAQLVRAGEDVRWLPRQHASELLLPGNDFWMYDRETIVFTNFSGDGRPLDRLMTTDSTLVEACGNSFDEAWKLAIPHTDYTPT